MSRTRAALTAALLLVSALAISGCSDNDPVPKQAPSPTSTPTTASTSPTPEALGPEETVRAWVAAQNQALKTGDTTGMTELAASSCRGCADFSKPIDRVVARGGSFKGGSWRVEALNVKGDSRHPIVNVAVTVASGETTPRAGAQPVVYQADKSIMMFRLREESEGLRIALIAFVG